MKPSITFAEIRAIVTALRKYEGGYIEKSYIDENNLSLKFRKSGLGSSYLHFMNNEFFFISSENMIEGKKNLLPIENMQISSIRQMGTDRVIVIEGQEKKIILEMMGGGNIYVTEGGNIIFIKKKIKRKGVLLEKGQNYVEPDTIDILSESFSLEKRILESTAEPVRTLGARIGLSKYSEEIICALGNNIRNNSDLIINLDKLKSLIFELLRESEDGKLYVYEDRFFIWKSKCLDDIPKIMSIEEGLRYVYEKSLEYGNSKVESIKRDIQKMQEEMEKLKLYGEIIMQNLHEIDTVLSLARMNKLEGNLIDYDKGLVKYIKEDKEIPLKMNLSAGENASEFFNSAKKIKDKLSRVSVEENNIKRESSKKEKVKLNRIFTNYRWFVTSEGNLVLAGKDAQTNDSVVKKYMDEKDLYFHADIHGAPSVILKNKNGIGEKSIMEAAQFAWCMSRAWNARFGNGAVYYVTKSQVSKTPETGEYLARGAWIIRGKKNYVTHLELELSIGFQLYENRNYLVSAPPSAINGKKVTIIPGNGKEEIVNKISDILNVEKEMIYPILPPGEIDIREIVDEKSDLPGEPESNNQ